MHPFGARLTQCASWTEDRPNPLQELELRVRARGFSFMPCDVKMLDAEEMKLVKWRKKTPEMVGKGGDGDGDVEENTLPNMDLKVKLEGSIDSIVHVGLLVNW